MSLLTWMAQAGSGASEIAPYLTALNLGLAGIGLWAFTTGKVHSDKELQQRITAAEAQLHRCQVKLDAAEAELRQRNADDRQTLIPAVVRMTDVLLRDVERRTGESTPPPPTRKASPQ